MPKPFDSFHREAIGSAIAYIENHSHAEAVVVVKPRVQAYAEYPLAAGVTLAFVALTYFRFSPEFFDDWMVYAGTVAGFVIGVVLTVGIPPLHRWLIGKQRRAKAAEILARACFQKGGIHHTRDKTGLLIFIAVWERQIVILPDRGVELAVPPKEWERIQQGFKGFFQARHPAEEFIRQMENLSAVLSQYVPQVEDDVNELPDRMDIDL